MLKSKIHKAIITETDLYYEGSISIDRDLMEEVGLIAYEKVSIYNINNGNRFDTYVIEGERGSGMIGVNGAAARLVHYGDEIIIVSFALLNDNEVKTHKPLVIAIEKDNKIYRKVEK